MPAVGRFGYGFNLDGKGAASPNGFEDPQTHEKGVNNQLFRAIGCLQAYKGYPPPQPPLEAEYRWDYSRAGMGAWLISISGADFDRDGEVTVTFESSMDPVTTQDANAHIQSDMTYRVAAHPASHNVLHGRIHDGVIITEPATIRMHCDAYIQPVYEFLKARMRLESSPTAAWRACSGATSRGTPSTGVTPRWAISMSAVSASTPPRFITRCAATQTPILIRNRPEHRDLRRLHDRSGAGVHGARRRGRGRAAWPYHRRNGRRRRCGRRRRIRGPDPRSGTPTAIPGARPLHGASRPISTARSSATCSVRRSRSRADSSRNCARRLVRRRRRACRRHPGGMEQYDAMARAIASQVVSERHRAR